MRHGQKLLRWTRSGERRPEEGYGSRLESPRCANAACSKTRKVTTHLPVKEVREEHGSTTDFETALRDNFAGWVPQLTWRESHRSGRSDTESRTEWRRSEWRALMLLPRFQVRTSCNGWMSQSGGQQLRRTWRVRQEREDTHPRKENVSSDNQCAPKLDDEAG